MRRALWTLPWVIVAIGFAPILVRLALPAPPVVIGFYRMAIASAVLVGVLALLRRRPVWGDRAGWAALGAGFAFGTDHALWNTSLTLTTVAVATLLVNLSPLHVGLWAWWRGEQPDLRFAGGAALAIAGCALLVGRPAVPLGALGPALALVASLFYAAYVLCLAVARRETDALSVFTWVTLASAATLGGYALALGEPLRGFPAQSWLAIAALALVSQLGGVFGTVWCMRWLDARFASVALVGQPAVAAALGWWLLGESLGAWQGLGAIAVLAGIALAAQRRGPEPVE